MSFDLVSGPGIFLFDDIRKLSEGLLPDSLGFGEDSGREGATLVRQDDGSMPLYFADDRNQERVTIGLWNGSPGVASFEDRAVRRAILAMDTQGRILELDGPDAKPRILIREETAGQPHVLLGDRDGKVIWSTPGGSSTQVFGGAQATGSTFTAPGTAWTTRWTKPGVTEKDFQLDRYACIRDARRSGTAMLYVECMRAKGYVRVN